MTDIIEITNPDRLEIDPDEMDLVEVGYISGGFTPVPGPPGEIEEHEVQIAAASLTWQTTHTLNRDPLVVTVDVDGNEIWGDVRTTHTTIQVNWAVPIAGTLRYY